MSCRCRHRPSFSPLPGFEGSGGSYHPFPRVGGNVSVPFRGLRGLEEAVVVERRAYVPVSVPFRGLRGLEEQTQPEHLVAPLPCVRASPHS